MTWRMVAAIRLFFLPIFSDMSPETNSPNTRAGWFKVTKNKYLKPGKRNNPYKAKTFDGGQ